MLRKLFMAVFVLMLPVLAFGQVSEAGKPVKVVTDADIVGTTVWSRDTIWNMSGFVYVENGEILIIEPGTIIKGDPGTAENATALIVAKGGKIHAEGTPTSPIIFTSVSDDVDDPNDIPLGAAGRGLWGSVIILGDARLNTASGTAQIEGIPGTEVRGNYGGTDDNDNSGVFRYVSLRHGGSIIGAANEINGLTMGGVGRGTVIDHVEAYQNLDDGFEFFGGTVNTSHLATVFCDDDGFDWDFGFTGTGQFWFVLKDSILPSSGSRAFEIDACTSPATPATPAILSQPYISNVTAIGSDADVAESDNDYAISYRSGTAGRIYNSIFTDFSNRAIDLPNASQVYLGNELKLVNNIFFGFKNFTIVDSLVNGADQIADVAPYFSANNDLFVNPGLGGISRTNSGDLDPRPSGAAATGGIAVPGADDPLGLISDVAYQGAFHPTDAPWICHWTATSFCGILAPCAALAECDCVTEAGKPVAVFTDADMVGTINWTKDTVINLSGFVYVENGEQLIIGPGTVIKGDPGTAENATALIVARGGKIYGEGAADCPIVMTAITDDVDNPTDIPLGASGRGLWGSLIVLGDARLNTASGTAQIEGIPGTETRGNYGGTDDNDNSGVLRYVSLRHGGSIIGAANEINGLTMGGVGRGTVIDHIEAYQNLDDGFEFFGGTVNAKYLVNAFCDDDGFDWDFGFTGTGQYWFTIKDASLPSSGSRAFEIDACTSPATPATPAILSQPYISNVTAIGSGAASGETDNDYAISYRSGTAGRIYNSIFVDFAQRAIDLPNASQVYLGNELKLVNNVFNGFKNFTLVDSLVRDADQITDVAPYFSANNDLFVDPKLRGISRTQNNGLDPRPGTAFPAATGGIAVPGADDPLSLIEDVAYQGAFNPSLSLANSWLGGWTFLYCGDHLGEQADPPAGCCIGTTGNVNKSVAETPDLSDLSLLISYLTVTPKPALPCLAEANVNASVATTPDLSDLSLLIAYLTTTPKPTLPNCP